MEPNWAAYLAQLPNGIDSYPTYQRKAVQYRHLLDATPQAATIVSSLPPTIAELIRHPAPVSSMIPTVHENALYLALRESCYASDEEMLAATFRVNQQLINGPLYRIMMTFMSPEALIKVAAVRWSAFNKGITLRSEVIAKGHAKAQFAFPANLYTPFLSGLFCAVFRAAIESAGGKNVRFVLSDHSTTLASYEGRWS